MFQVITRRLPPVLLLAGAGVDVLLTAGAVLVLREAVREDDVDVDVGEDPPGGVMPGGNQPPPAHVQPAAGCGVTQPSDGAPAATAAGLCPAGAAIPGGNQPPLTHVQPDAGCAVAQPSDGTEGADDREGAAALRGGVVPGGNQPPFAQIHPGPGCTVVHSEDDEDGAGATSPLGNGMAGGNHPPP